jgi:tetratricopeptide (TPR) repeat protein
MIDRWRTAFKTDPTLAIADLFSGRAGLGAGLRLDIPELLYQEFPDTPEQAGEREALDDALRGWLVAMRKDYAAQVKRLGFGVYSLRVCAALSAAHLLELPRTIDHIRQTLGAWLDSLIPLRVAPERDPALECWRLLTLRQPDAAHTAAWLRLAADPRSEYLSVALAGLQRLPNQGDARLNQVLLVTALLHHAARDSNVDTAYQFFTQRYSALRGVYPAGPEHWQAVLDDALKGFQNHAKKQPTAHALIAQINAAPKPKQRKKPPAVTERVRPVDLGDKEQLLRDIRQTRQSGDSLAARLFTILQQDHRYADATGDSHYFVHTLSNHSTQLLKRHRLSADSLARLSGQIERGLAWEPMNPFMWMLWANALAHQQRWAAQEWVLQETARLFPCNEPARVELARLLIRRGEDRWDEAELWLREAAEFSPKHARVELARHLIQRGEGRWEAAERWLPEFSPHDESSRVELARLLIRRGVDRWDEAECWLREVAEFSPKHARVELARLLIRRGEDRWDEAERWLREVAEFSPKHEPSRVELARLLMWRGAEHWDEAERWLREAVERNPDREHSRVELARLLIQRGEGRWDEAERWLREVADSNPTNGPSHRVLATLWIKQGKRTEAIELLEKFLARNPQDRIARDLLEKLQAGSDAQFDEYAVDDMDSEATPPFDRPSPNLPPVGGGTHSTALPPEAGLAGNSSDRAEGEVAESGLLDELARRGGLQSEFHGALSAKAANPDTALIDTAAAHGDALAGLFRQWLSPDSSAEPPPHAWAWRACRLYQTAAAAEDWQQLERDCNEFLVETRFLYLQTLQEDEEREEQARRFHTRFIEPAGGKGLTPLEQFMAATLHRPPSPERALAVLSSAAVGAPQFLVGA